MVEIMENQKQKIEYLTENAQSNIVMIEEAFNIHDKGISDLIGQYKSCWLGYSTNQEIKKRAASGGIVTELLLHALGTGMVNKVFISRLKGINVETVLTDETATILSGQGSIYCPDIVSFTKIEDRHCAVVGLPCQIKRLRSANNHPLLIGLFCGHTIMREGMDFLLKHLGVTGDIKYLIYRFKLGNETGLLVGADGRPKFIPLSKYYGQFFNFFFIPARCLRCNDQTAEHADISCGDAWLRGYKNMSIFIVRTERGERLVRSAVEAKVVEADITLGENVIKSQKRSLYIKKGKDDLSTRIYKLLRQVGCYISGRPRLHFIIRWYLKCIGIKP